MPLARIRKCIQRAPVVSLSQACGISTDSAIGASPKVLGTASSAVLLAEGTGTCHRTAKILGQQVRQYGEPAYQYSEHDAAARGFGDVSTSGRSGHSTTIAKVIQLSLNFCIRIRHYLHPSDALHELLVSRRVEQGWNGVKGQSRGG
jgi:hypothetical protein